MKIRFPFKTIFFLLGAFCISLCNSPSVFARPLQHDMSPEEKVLLCWNDFFDRYIQNEDNSLVQPALPAQSARREECASYLKNLRSAILEYKKSDLYIVELNGALSKTAHYIEEALLEVDGALSAIQDGDDRSFTLSCRNLCFCMNYFQHSVIENLNSSLFPFVELLSMISFLAILIVVAAMAYLNNKRKLEILTEKNIHEKLITKSIVEIQESERNRISRELHDTVTQDSRTVLLFVNRLEGILNQLFNKEISNKENKAINAINIEENQQKVEQAQAESTALISKIKSLETQNLLNIRNIIRNLTPPEIENADFINLLNEYAVNVTEFNGLPCKFYAEKTELYKNLSGTQKLHIFRIIQEAVTNALKHSGAEEISIFVRSEKENAQNAGGKEKQKLVFVVSDDGKGIDEDKKSQSQEITDTDSNSTHLGIKGIFSRAEILGGTAEIKSSPEIGTTIILKVEC
ncbi:MAG: sensor histidine kinase [Treponema sp.]